MTQAASASDHSVAELEMLRTELGQKSEQIEELRTELGKKSEQIDELMKEHEKLDEANSKVFDLDMEVVELRAELKVATENYEELETKNKQLLNGLQSATTSGHDEGLVRELQGECIVD
jgi:uncharacterized coiled-coil DUF342 family protein